MANETWAADETELKANANKRIRQQLPVLKTSEPKEDDLQLINDVRTKHGKRPLPPTEPKEIAHVTNFSPVDPAARLSVKHVKRGQFAYFEHRVVDTLRGFILLSPLVPATFILIGLVGVGFGEHQKFLLKWAFGANIVMTIAAVLLGVISF